MYANRYELEPRKRKLYEEACDLIEVYGLPRTFLNYKGKCNREELKEIWNFAIADCEGKSSYCFSFSYGGER